MRVYNANNINRIGGGASFSKGKENIIRNKKTSKDNVRKTCNAGLKLG